MTATIFEIFTSHDGRTQGYRHGEEVARRICNRINSVGPFHDYLPARREGFYVVDDRGFVISKHPFSDRRYAEALAETQRDASRQRVFSVVEHRL